MIKGPVVTRHRVDPERYEIKSRRTGETMATVLYDFVTDSWNWKLDAKAKAAPRAAVKPERSGREKSLSEAQAVVEYLVRRHNLDRT